LIKYGEPKISPEGVVCRAGGAFFLSRNLELKARCAKLEVCRQALSRLDIRLHEVELQTDTYFQISSGRLKLREIEGSRASLIWYERPDSEQARISQYHLTPIADLDSINTLLAAALGVRGRVSKRREIYLWHNVRIHLDEVAGLGSFVELEAVLGPGDQEGTAHERLEHLTRMLKLERSGYRGKSYADLLGL
jgi:predicted adenylyl cyclase CyaB